LKNSVSFRKCEIHGRNPHIRPFCREGFLNTELKKPLNGGRVEETETETQKGENFKSRPLSRNLTVSQFVF
jgi:hypothetical protein